MELGAIDTEQRGYYDQLLKKDFELGQKLIDLQHKKWRGSLAGRTPSDLHHFMATLKNDGRGREYSEKQEFNGKETTNQEVSAYELMLKTRGKGSKRFERQSTGAVQRTAGGTPPCGRKKNWLITQPKRKQDGLYRHRQQNRSRRHTRKVIPRQEFLGHGSQ